MAISTVLVVGYAIALVPLTFIGMLHRTLWTVVDSLIAPLAFPVFIARFFGPPEARIPARMPIEQTILLIGWILAVNILIYYLPVKWFLQWQDQRFKLP